MEIFQEVMAKIKEVFDIIIAFIQSFFPQDETEEA